MNRGDIYMVSLDPTMGHEQAGRRPVIIITPEPFNRLTDAPIIAPITTGGAFAIKYGFAVELDPLMKTKGHVRCDQLRTLDLGARRATYVEAATPEVIDEILAKIATLVT